MVWKKTSTFIRIIQICVSSEIENAIKYYTPYYISVVYSVIYPFGYTPYAYWLVCY